MAAWQRGVPTPESWQGSKADCFWQRLDCRCWTENSHFGHSWGAILFTATTATVAPSPLSGRRPSVLGVRLFLWHWKVIFWQADMPVRKTSDSRASEKVWWDVRSRVNSLWPQTAGGWESRHSSASGTQRTTEPSGCNTGRWRRMRLQYIKFSSKI